MTNRLPTLDDVAAKAGVSAKTVARVVNKEACVSERTRALVECAIAELGYRANLTARSLASSRAYRVALISPNLSAYYISQMYEGAWGPCRMKGYQLAIQQLDVSDAVALVEFAEVLSDQPLDGVFLAAPTSDCAALLDLLDRKRVRYVRHSPMTQTDRSDSVFADDLAGMEALVGHLWDKGHRHFGVVAGPDGHLASRLRLQGMLEAIDRRGGPPDQVEVIKLDARGALDLQGSEAAAQFLALSPRPTAIVCYNDTAAAGVLAEAHRQGVDVPGELAVTGYGNADFSHFLWPRLTTIHQPNMQMANAAVEWLTGPSAVEPRCRRFPVHLIARGST